MNLVRFPATETQRRRGEGSMGRNIIKINTKLRRKGKSLLSFYSTLHTASEVMVTGLLVLFR